MRTSTRSRGYVFPPQDLGRARAYLQIVESRRDGDQVRQQVIATLGEHPVRAAVRGGAGAWRLVFATNSSRG